MTIETKYDLHEFAYLIYDNKIDLAEILHIEVTIGVFEPFKKPHVKYKISPSKSNIMVIDERRLFKTKEELLLSL